VVAELDDGAATLRAFTGADEDRRPGDRVGVRISSALVYDQDGNLT
jgi:hypothetical protein